MIDDSTRQSWLDDCRRLTEQIAAELSDRIYWVDARQLEGLPQASCAAGWFVPGDDVLADLGGRLPGWSGQRHVICLDLERIASTALDVAAAALCVAIHEAGHATPYREPNQPSRSYPADVLLQFTLERFEQSITDAPQDQHGSHAADFCRRTLHLWLRANFAGWQPDFVGLLAGGLGEGHERQLLAELVGEAYQLRQADFATIEQQPPPIGFTRLWRMLERRQRIHALEKELEQP